MIVAIHQPDYIPYLGYFYKMSKCDVWVHLDDCQFSNVNWHHWNRIKTSQGECRLKIPVEQHLGYPINKVRTRDELKWKAKHLKAVEMNYKKASHFEEVFHFWKELLIKDYENIADMNIAINTAIAQRLGFHPIFHCSSEMSINTMREERVIDICLQVGGDEYLSGRGAADYELKEDFKEKGLKLTYSDYIGIKYTQLWGGFLPNLSILDFLFNCGFDWNYVVTEMEKHSGDR